MYATPTGAVGGAASLVALTDDYLPTVAGVAGNYPTTGQIPSFTVDAKGRLISITSTNVLNGIYWGSSAMGGSPTFGVNVAMGTNKITGLGNGTTSSDAAAFGQIAAAVGTRGGTVITFVQTSAQSWSASSFIGISPAAATGSISSVQFWIAPKAGVLSNLWIQGVANAPALGATLTVCTGSGGSSIGTPSQTFLSVSLTSAKAGSDTTHTANVSAGDLVAIQNVSANAWSHSGVCCSLMWTPT